MLVVSASLSVLMSITSANCDTGVQDNVIKVLHAKTISNICAAFLLCMQPQTLHCAVLMSCFEHHH